MKNQKETIRKIVGYLNNEDKDGGFWLPNIQRPFVWNEDQIERLFDSIMREYPISTLLIWRTNSPIRRRKFIDNYKHTIKLTDFYVPVDTKGKLLVLDGQQRLQSFFIGLKGSYEKKELYFDVLSGNLVAPDDIRYKFKFLNPASTNFPWIKFKDIVFSYEQYDEIAESILENADDEIDKEEKTKLRKNIARVVKQFCTDEILVYQELDSIDNPKAYGEDDVVEIFIRANAGGTKLGKSDLLFSLLTSAWEDADERMEELLDKLNKSGFDFTRDFTLKTCLSVLGIGEFAINNIFDIIRSDGRSLEITSDSILGQYYGSRDIHLIFNLWYRDFNYTPSYENNLPQIDHIFPQSLLRTAKDISPDTGRRSVLHYRWEDRNQIANCMLLTAEENGAGGKWDTSPEVWFADKPKSYLDLHLIPENRELWNLEKFDEFVDERKKLILHKFSHLIQRKTD